MLRVVGQDDRGHPGPRQCALQGFRLLLDGNCAQVDARSARLADNEAVFRLANDAIASNRRDRADRHEYLCECGDEECFERLQLSKDEYETVRAHPARFFVAPGHEDLTAGEVVVAECNRYSVVEKRGEEREIVERSYGPDR